MLHLDATTKRQTLHIPRANTQAGAEAYTLTLQSTVNRQMIKPTDADHNADFSFDYAKMGTLFETGIYYVAVTLNFPTKPTRGEYEYILKDGDTLVSRGLLQVGSVNADFEEYNAMREYEQYGG